MVRSSERSELSEDTSSSTLGTSRRMPFVVHVATTWTHIDDLPDSDDGQLRYWRRAPLTGNVTTTSAGRDVSFGDLEVS